ncbi:MAG: 50S ribosomal protein L29 [Aggregatilineales bacterium]
MKASDLREMPTHELLNKIEAARKEMFNLKLAARADTLENPQQISGMRKDMARMLTVLRERELAAAYIEAEGANTSAALEAVTPKAEEVTNGE